MGEADLFDDVAAALIVPGKHAAGHDEVSAGAEGLCEIARACAAAVGDDMTVEAVGCVGAFDHGGELRVPDTPAPTQPKHRSERHKPLQSTALLLRKLRKSSSEVSRSAVVRLSACGADGSGSDADLYGICPSIYECFSTFACSHISG